MIEKEWEAYFDLFTFDEWMDKENAFMVVVFPEDFDEKILLKKVEEKYGRRIDYNKTRPKKK